MSDTADSELDKLFQSYLRETTRQLPATDPAKKILEEVENFSLEQELKLLARLEHKELDEIREEMARDKKRVMIRVNRQRRNNKVVNEIIRLSFVSKKLLPRTTKWVLERDLKRLVDVDGPLEGIGLGDTAKMIRNAEFCENCNHTRLAHLFGPCLNCGRCSTFREKNWRDKNDDKQT